MKISKNNIEIAHAQPAQQGKKPTNPKVFQSLDNYQNLKQQLYDHFFEGKILNINNKKYSSAYSQPFNMMNDSSFVIKNDKQYESVEESFLNVYKNDLVVFGRKIYQQIGMAKGLKPQEQISWICKWINSFSRFNHWIYKTFMIIERNAMKAQGIRLYFEGIKILKTEVIDKIYQDLYVAIHQCLQIYKQGYLRAFEPLQIIIKYIGIIGYTKFRLVQMVKTPDDRFQYQSNKQQGDQIPQNAYNTGIFRTNFIARLIKDLKSKYSEIVNGLMQLSTPEYFERAKRFIDLEEDTADHFYGYKPIKETVLRNVLEILIVERAEGLLKNPKSGITKMMNEKDVQNLQKIYQLLKKSNMVKVFFKQFQNYIQAQGQQILNKISPEDEKAMKKQTILGVFGEIVQFNQTIDFIRQKIDANDAQLQKSQNTGFQGFCNIGNKVCNYLAYYADLMLKKDDGGNNNSEQIVTQVGKISKYLYSYDQFMKMHQKLLGLRILYDNFKNQQAEYALIGMLKNQAGLNATSKISNMITDQKASESWNIQFQLRNKFSFVFDVMMLTSGSWEINDPKCGKTLVPPLLLPSVQAFQAKFAEKMPNRSVSWIFTHGRAIVQLISNSNAKYVLILNNYQLLTVLLFQQHGYKPIKLGDLLSILKIDDENFYRSSLISLLKNGVLVKQGQPGKIQSKSDEFIFNLDFKYKTQKVSCSIIPKYTEKTANTAVQVSAERCILIDAVLVKIMKQRKRAPYAEVIIQIQKMCKTFKAQIPQIKLRIQNCQQREFLERDPNDMNVLIYKP